MKTRSLELYSLPYTFGEQPLTMRDTNVSACTQSHLRTGHNGIAETHVLRHKFPEMTYRGVSFSQPQIQVSTSDDLRSVTTARVSLLAYDVLRGLFHYEVTMQISASLFDSGSRIYDSNCSTAVDMDVKLVAAHKMAEALDPASLIAGTDTPTPRSASGARGFVSACVLGPQGRRGIWIERQRGSMDRTVFGFSGPPVPEHQHPAVGGVDDEQGQVEDTSSGGHASIEGKPLHEVRNSYDLGGKHPPHSDVKPQNHAR